MTPTEPSGFLAALLAWAVADDWRMTHLLPGLYVAALGLACSTILRHFYDPLPRLASAAFSLWLAILFAPSLLGGKALLPLDNLRSAPPYAHLPAAPPGWHALQSDLVLEIAPHQAQVRRAFARGEWPLWNDLTGAGMPLLADPQTQALQPFVVLSFPFSLTAAAGVTAALRVGAALVFGFLLFRRLGLGDAAALFASSAYGLSGCVQLWLGWPLVNAVALLPAVLYAGILCFEEGRHRDVVLLTVATTATLLGGQPETIAYCLSFAGLVFVARAAAERRQRRDRWRGALAAWALSFALAAPALLVAAEYMPKTQWSAALAAAFGNRGALDALSGLGDPDVLRKWRDRATQRAAGLFAARPWGNHSIYSGETNVVEDAAGFAGTATLLLAILSLFGRAGFRHERLVRWTLFAGIVLLLQPPGFEFLTYQIPLVGFTAAHKHRRILMLIAFCCCYLAGCGLERWRQLAASHAARGRVVWATVAVVLALVLCGYSGRSDPARPSAVPYRWLALQSTALLATGALLSMRRDRRLCGVALLACVAGELLLTHVLSNIPNSRALAYPDTAGTRFLQQNLGGARMVGIGRAFPANVPSIYGLADARIRNASTPADYQRVVAELDSGRLEPFFERPRDPLYDLLSARYVAARPAAALDLPLVYQGSDLAIFERPTALPRLFLPRHAEFHRGGDWADWVHANSDFARTALVLADNGPAWHATKPGGRLEISTLRSTLVESTAVLPQKSLVASSIYQDGNWVALLDNRPQPVFLANGPFLATWMPAGRHRLTLLYRPRAFFWGCWIAALGLSIALATGLRPPRFATSKS